MKLAATITPVILLVLSVRPAVALEADWPQWRGPDRTDISSEKGLLRVWPRGGPERRWLFENCGVGYSGPAIVGKTLYIMGARGGVEQLFALDIESGKEIWSTDVGGVFQNGRGNGPRSTPTVAGGRVYALGGEGDVVCADATAGKVVWKASLRDLGGSPPHWGYTESVLADGERVICTPGGGKGAVVALDALTGKVLWQSKDFTDPAQYASPIVAVRDGVRQYIQLTMQSLAGFDAASGKVLWKSSWPGRTAVVPTPIYHDGQVYITSGYGVGCKLVKIGSDNRASDVWVNKNMKNQHGGVILLDGHVYGYSDNRGWMCQEFTTGEVVWAEKRELGKGAIGYADGRFYCLSESDGTVALIDASSAGWKERGRFTLAPRSKLRQPRWLIWTHPVVTGGRLYLRNQELLFCFDVEKR